MRIPSFSSLILLLLALTGCALQVTSGVNWANERRPAGLAIAGTTESGHANGGVLGARVGMDFEHGLVPRQGIIHAGLDWHLWPGRLVLEPGLDLGLGGPIARVYSGLGGYLGAAASGRFRLLGVDEAETAFNVIGARMDIVLAGRGGAWMPPEGTASTRLIGEYGVELGLRFAFSTDVYSGRPGKVQAPVDAERTGGQP